MGKMSRSVIIIGFGYIGKKYYNIIRNNQKFNIVGIVDKKQSESSKSLKNIIFKSLIDTLNKYKPELVIVSNNDFEHFRTLKTLINHSHKPRAIICEKPLSMLSETSKLIYKKLKEKGIRLFINYSRRYVEEYKLLKAELKNQNIVSVNIKYAKGFRHNGSHVIDFIRFFFGEIKEYKILSEKYDYFKDDPSISLYLRTKKVENIFVTSLDESCFTHFEIDIITNRCRVIIDNDHSRIRRFKLKKKTGDPPGTRFIEDKKYKINHFESISNILECSFQSDKLTKELLKSEEIIDQIFFSKFSINLKVFNLLSQYNLVFIYISDPGEYNLIKLALSILKKNKIKFHLICSHWAEKNIKEKYLSENDAKKIFLNTTEKNTLLILGPKIHFEQTHNWIMMSKQKDIDSAFFFNHWKHYNEHFPIENGKRIYSNYIFFPDKLALDSFLKTNKNINSITSTFTQMEVERIFQSVKKKSLTKKTLFKKTFSSKKIILFLFDPEPVNKKLYPGYNTVSTLRHLKKFIEQNFNDCFFIFRAHPRQDQKLVKNLLQKYLSKNNWIIDNKSDVSDLFHISKEIWGMTTVLLVAALKLKKKIISFQINRNRLGIELSNPYIEPFTITK